MWVRKIELNEVKCIEQLSIDLGTDEERFKWVTLLGDNGTGKTTILQALALTLSGRNPIGLAEFINILYGNNKDLNSNTPYFPVQTLVELDEKDISTKQTEKGNSIRSVLQKVAPNCIDKVIYGDDNAPPVTYPYNNDVYSIRQSSLFEANNAQFAAGYGAFRHISKKETLSVPQIVEPKKRNNFLTLFEELESLGGFHQWLITLDYQRNSPRESISQKEEEHYNLAIQALNDLLPANSTFHSVDSKGIWYTVNGQKVSASYLSDGFRSILALVGDLLWRLMHTYPESDNPLHETGVVLIDELAIHLHPKWQRQIAGDLQRTFPNLQFIVTTHSPLIASGAGKDAVTYQLELDEQGKTQIEEIKDIYAWSLDRSLQSEAFDLDSAFSKEIAALIKEYYSLMGVQQRTELQETRLNDIRPTIRKAIGEQANEKSSLEKRMDEYIAKHWK